MKPLRLQYLDKYRLWREIVQARSDRLFVPTEERIAIGDRVALELSLPSVSLHMVMQGTVVGRRHQSRRFVPGVYLRFAPAEFDKCRRFLGLGQPLDYVAHGRKSPRVACALPVKFVQPELGSAFVARDISANGLQVSGAAGLLPSQRVILTLGFDDGTQLPVVAEVCWVDGTSGGFGLRFVELSAEAQTVINSAIDRLKVADPDAQRSHPIVVADDDAEILTTLTRALTRSGYQVYQTRRGEEALELIRELRPPLVVLDVLLPGIDGVDICKTMRADAEMADIPVIFLSALDSSRLQPVAEEAGATDYLTKPIAVDELTEMVAHYLPSVPPAAQARKPDDA